MTDIDVMSDRVAIFEALKHLIVAGNVLLFVGEDGIRVFPLSRYVVKRDPSGNVIEIVTKESLSPNMLPEEIRPAVVDQLKGDEKSVDLFTYIHRKKDKFVVFQEVILLLFCV